MKSNFIEKSGDRSNTFFLIRVVLLIKEIEKTMSSRWWKKKKAKRSRGYSKRNKEFYAKTGKNNPRNPKTETKQKEFASTNLLNDPMIFQYPQKSGDSTSSNNPHQIAWNQIPNILFILPKPVSPTK